MVAETMTVCNEWQLLRQAYKQIQRQTRNEHRMIERKFFL